MATEAINLKPLIATSGNKKTGVVVTGFKDAAVDPVPTEHGTLYQLRVKQPGLASAINQFNIRFAYDVAQNTTVPTPRVGQDAGRRAAGGTGGRFRLGGGAAGAPDICRGQADRSGEGPQVRPEGGPRGIGPVRTGHLSRRTLPSR
ncbi:hypothetical protein [Streptomyces sp. enrichment culture]|uniref:hypothetical protein n=1 Tax=Streptomyces sp. enrichment culture TaxID=1795815 RepID=UPI003F56D212